MTRDPKPKKLAIEIPSLVYTPTLFAYVWIVVHWVIAGVALYLIAVFVTHKTGGFERMSQWPVLPKIVLYEGALFILLGLLFSFQPTKHWMIIPLGVQGVLRIIAWLSLRTANSESSEQ
jgi:hypothetical protein